MGEKNPHGKKKKSDVTRPTCNTSAPHQWGACPTLSNNALERAAKGDF